MTNAKYKEWRTEDDTPMTKLLGSAYQGEYMLNYAAPPFVINTGIPFDSPPVGAVSDTISFSFPNFVENGTLHFTSEIF